MEPDDLVMIPGRIKTIREMRNSTAFLPLEKLNAAIETLEASRTTLEYAFQQFQATGTLSHGANPEELNEWAASVWDQLDQLQEARQRLLQETSHTAKQHMPAEPAAAPAAWKTSFYPPDQLPSPAVWEPAAQHSVIENDPVWEPDPNSPKAILTLVPQLGDISREPDEFELPWEFGHGLLQVLQRSMVWGVETPDLHRLARLDAWFSASSCTADQLLATLKYTFWTMPTLRVPVAYLVYSHYWRHAVSLTESLQEFRTWLIGVLKTTPASAATQQVYGWLQFQNPQEPWLHHNTNLSNSRFVLDQLTTLLWLSVPAGDTQTAQLCLASSGPDREHGIHYVERARYYHALWSRYGGT